MSTSIGDVFLSLKLDKTPYNKELGNVKNNAQSVGGQIGDLLGKSIGKKLATALSVAGLTAFINKCLELNSTFHAVSDMAGMAFPHMTDEVNKFAKSAMDSFGLSETSALKFSSTFGTMANSMGIAEEQAWTMSKNLTALAGDMASFYHISQDEASEKLSAVFSGETESLKRLGIMMTQTNLQQYALNQGYAVAYQNMTEAEKAMVRYNYVLSATSLAQGDASRYANAYGNQVLRLKQNFQQLQIAIGEGFRGVITPVLQWLNALLAKLIQVANAFSAWMKRVTGAFKPFQALGKSIKNTVTKVLGKDTAKQTQKTADSIGNVGSALGGTGKRAGSARKAIQQLKRELLGFDQITKLMGNTSDTGTTGAGGVGGGGGSLGGLGALGADIDLLDAYADKTNELKDVLANFKIPQALIDAFAKLRDALSHLGEVLINFGKWAFENVLKPLGKWLVESALPPIIESIASVIEIIANVLEALGVILKPLWENILKPLFNFLGDVAEGILQGIAGVLEAVAKSSESWADVLQDVFDGFTSSLTAVKDAWESLKKLVGGAIVTATVTLKDLFSSAWEKVKGVWNGIKDIARTATLSLLDKFSNLWNGIKGVWNGITNITRTATLSLLDKFSSAWNGVKGVWDSLKNSTAVKTIDGILGAGWQKIVDLWNSITNSRVYKYLFGDEDKSFTTGKTSWDSIKDGSATKRMGLIKGQSWSADAFKVVNSADGGVVKRIGLTKGKSWNTDAFKVVNTADDKTIKRTVTLSWKDQNGNSVSRNTVQKMFAKNGGVYSGGSWHKITQYAGGGTPDRGQLFVAREAGAELVGTLGGHTAVMNNDQIVASVSAGVAKAMAGIRFQMKIPHVASTGTNVVAPSSMQGGSESSVRDLLILILRAIGELDFDVNLDGESIKRDVVRRINEHTISTGRLELVI